MNRRVLHILSQRPGRTGSGVTLAAFVQGAARRGWQQRVIVGTPISDPHPVIPGIDAEHVCPLVFETTALSFPVPGMSDVMPYNSSVFSSLTPRELDIYRDAWVKHIGHVVDKFRPDIIHSHHVWIVSSLLKQNAPNLPIVTSCHATGLRQASLCPHLVDDVRRGCAENDAFLVLHEGHANELQSMLEIEPSKVFVVGAGFDDEIFNTRGRADDKEFNCDIVYAGKYSFAKGLPSLLDAIEKLTPEFPNLRLHIAGSGSGTEADSLRNRMIEMQPQVILHGQLSQAELSTLFQQSALFVLPSFFEGLPLVVVEAMACGCRVVCTDLPGIRGAVDSFSNDRLQLIALPRMKTVDQPVDEDLPAFVDRIADSVRQALTAPTNRTSNADITQFSWLGVFDRVETVWTKLLSQRSSVSSVESD